MIPSPTVKISDYYYGITIPQEFVIASIAHAKNKLPMSA
jgi:hypothetical protein